MIHRLSEDIDVPGPHHFEKALLDVQWKATRRTGCPFVFVFPLFEAILVNSLSVEAKCAYGVGGGYSLFAHTNDARFGCRRDVF